MHLTLFPLLEGFLEATWLLEKHHLIVGSQRGGILSPRFGDVSFIKIIASTPLWFIFLFPTQTYTIFTLKTFKGYCTTKIRTCSLKYLFIHLLKGCNLCFSHWRIISQKNKMWVYQEHLKHKNSLSCTTNNHFREDNKKFMS